MTESECKDLLHRVLALSKADSASVSMGGNEQSDVRFALSGVSTTGYRSDLSVNISSNFGRRSASASVNQLDDASLEKAVRKSEELARLAPEDPEFMEPVGPQQYGEARAFNEKTAAAGPREYAEVCRPAIEQSGKS